MIDPETAAVADLGARVDFAVVATVFGLIFVAELPDKTAISALVLGSKYPGSWVFTGVAAAFAVHVVIAVAAGSAISLLPHRPVAGIVGALFLLGAILLWREVGSEDEDEDDEPAGPTEPAAGFARVAAMAFGVIFVAEFGDLTQILCANLAAKYGSPLSVGLGSVLGLWAVGLLAILGGKTLLRVLPVATIARIAAVIMAGLAFYEILDAIR
jgi:putative Ca2+/H+ antiporter (TMEM165/GDT1 family)